MIGDEMVGITTRADDDAVHPRGVLHRMDGLDRYAIRGLDPPLRQADGDPAIALSPRKNVGGSKRFDDRAIGHHGKGVEDQDSE
jgi:hypothetical protein